ncbi:MAG: DNA primase [Bacteroidales bacterium]|nr:DNA primase [Bacteroidales bacterium]
MITDEVKQQVLDAVRIEEVVGDFVTLKRRGTNLIGLCPFHNEKTPSFIVSPAKGIYKCFGCGKGGDAVSFLMEHDQLTYPEALKALARKYGITIAEAPRSAEQIQQMNHRESLMQLSAFAENFFKEQLWKMDEGQRIGLPYFRERGFSDATIEAFSLGYSPQAWDALTQAAVKQAYSKDLLVEVGLSLENDQKKLYDRFRGRVMFPIHNLSGRVIAFGGRVLLTEKTKAKYVNSPESVIYNKSQVLYGIFQAKREIIAKDMAYLVEGYTDVISLHQAGITNVVASSGTSLTQDQIKLVSRFTRNITILYDGDAAGIKASFRGINMLLEHNLNVRVVLFPDGHDPDSFSRTHSIDEITAYLNEQAVDFIRFKTQLLLKEIGDDPIKRAALIEDIVESIALIPDEIYRAVYIQECSRILHIEEADLVSRLNKVLRQRYKQKLRENERRAGASEAEAEAVAETASAADQLTDRLSAAQQQTDALELEQQRDDTLERSILRLLISHGRETTTQCFLDEEGNELEEAMMVGLYVLRELEEDELQFSDPVNQRILSVFQKSVAENNQYVPTLEDLMAMEDEAVKNRIVDITYNPHEISPVWEKKLIRVPTAADARILNRMVLETLANFKLRQIEKTERALADRLKAADLSEEDCLQCLQYKKECEAVRRVLSEKIRRILV